MEADKQNEIGAPVSELTQRLAAVRLLALDVDGVLTDGRIRYVDDRELMQFDVKDGLGLVRLRRVGIRLAWITGRGCDATRRRAEELKVDELHMQSGPKAEVLARVQERLGVGPSETLAMGDDLPDLELASLAGLLVTPADAVRELRERADIVTKAAGGHGAVREVADQILAARAAVGLEADGATG
ncbi:MAG: 3-deoxy-D-manno-octulosonate 8-phosphate phosphatase (KDO 8-P phosphatase) [Planctomycetota bacterium]|jgi:3-deoxy-D-manno-octulosonate 8-phosphate phosphatase (KDO 8-P phosphatase)